MIKFVNMNYESRKAGFTLACRMSQTILDNMPAGSRRLQDIQSVLADIKSKATGNRLVKGVIPATPYRLFELQYVAFLSKHREKPCLFVANSCDVEQLAEVFACVHK